MEELKVENIIIGKQFENSEKLQEFLNIVKLKNIAIKVLEAGTRINIEKNLYIDFLWPSVENKINENSLNNNSLIGKLVYKKFSMLFTGDIESVAESKLVQLYGKNNILKSTVLKIAHHGSKTSSTVEFLKLVQPKIALIGVGKNNLYGHPNEEVLDRLYNLRCKSL